MNALELLPGVPINTWSVVLNGAEAYRYQTGTVAFPGSAAAAGHHAAAVGSRAAASGQCVAVL